MQQVGKMGIPATPRLLEGWWADDMKNTAIVHRLTNRMGVKGDDFGYKAICGTILYLKHTPVANQPKCCRCLRSLPKWEAK
jgi:hypothetical protein